jgi:hypothetical protein
MKLFKPQTHFLLILLFTIHLGCKKEDPKTSTNENPTIDSTALTRSKWKYLAKLDNGFDDYFRDLQPWGFDSSYTEILTQREYIRLDKNFKKSYSYPFIIPSWGNFTFNLYNSFYYTIPKTSSGLPQENLIAQHFPNNNSVSTILSSVQEFIGDSTQTWYIT